MYRRTSPFRVPWLPLSARMQWLFRSTVVSAVLRWAGIASTIMVLSLMSRRSRRTDRAAVLFDLPKIRTFPRTSLASLAMAWARCKGERPDAAAKEHRRAFPSVAITSSPNHSLRPMTY